jgi:hypothetical protein
MTPQPPLTNAEIEARYGDPGKAAFLESLRGKPPAEIEQAYVARVTGKPTPLTDAQRLERLAKGLGYDSIDEAEQDIIEPEGDDNDS